MNSPDGESSNSDSSGHEIILTTMASRQFPEPVLQGWSGDSTDSSATPAVPGYHLSKRPRHHSVSGAETDSRAGETEGGSFFFRNPTPAALQRSDQACDPCRERKTKCSGGHPTCKRCLSRGLLCHYSAPKNVSAKAAKTRSRAKTTTSAPKQRRNEFQAAAYVTPAPYPASTTTFELSTRLIQPSPAFQHETSTNSYPSPHREILNHEASLPPPQVALPVFTTIAIPTWPSLAEQQGISDTAPIDDAMSSLMDELFPTSIDETSHTRWDENDRSDYSSESSSRPTSFVLPGALAQPVPSAAYTLLGLEAALAQSDLSRHSRSSSETSSLSDQQFPQYDQPNYSAPPSYSPTSSSDSPPSDISLHDFGFDSDVGAFLPPAPGAQNGDLRASSHFLLHGQISSGDHEMSIFCARPPGDTDLTPRPGDGTSGFMPFGAEDIFKVDDNGINQENGFDEMQLQYPMVDMDEIVGGPRDEALSTNDGQVRPNS